MKGIWMLQCFDVHEAWYRDIVTMDEKMYVVAYVWLYVYECNALMYMNPGTET